MRVNILESTIRSTLKASVELSLRKYISKSMRFTFILVPFQFSLLSSIYDTTFISVSEESELDLMSVWAWKE